MEQFNENEEKIAIYLNGRMTALEEEAFMRQLSNDANLRQQYEDELLVSFLLKQSDEPNVNESITATYKSLTGKEVKKKDAAIIKPLWKYKNIAASALIVISATFVFILLKSANTKKEKIAAAPASNDTALHTDTSRKTYSLSNEKAIVATTFNNFYHPYIANQNDPVEISEYYDAYQKKQYKKVLAATKADYEVMGLGEGSGNVELYMNLYKGLAYLADNRPKNAIEQFNVVIRVASKKSYLYYNAQWYCALAWLKENNIAKAIEIAKNIETASSPNKLQAKQLIEQLIAR